MRALLRPGLGFCMFVRLVCCFLSRPNIVLSVALCVLSGSSPVIRVVFDYEILVVGA